MRSSLIVLLILVSFSHISCVHVYFKEPQTLEGVQLSEIPNELQGVWLEVEDDENDNHQNGISFDAKGLDDLRINKFEQTGNVDTLHRRTNLSDSLRLYKSGKFYLVNSRENSEYWEVTVLRIRHGDIFIYDCRDPDIYLKDQNLTLEEVGYSQLASEEDLIVKTMIEETSDTLKFQHALYSGQMSSKTVRRIAKKRNLQLIMREDGSVWSRKNED
ncbi:MAG: hypothetical protein ACI865_003119 [Flavobacteriaceae bacterium]|jgi:hypothetical protein